jgi:SAM-dependent methyltransferase
MQLGAPGLRRVSIDDFMQKGKEVSKNQDWGARAQKGFLASGIDPADQRGQKNHYIDLLQRVAIEEALHLKGDERVLDFGCGSGRISYWIAPKVKGVIGLEVTPEMIELAERNRTSEKVEFKLYDGVHFPVFPFSFDFVLSVGVLQTMKGELLENTVSQLAQYLKSGGKMVLIEQASDNPERNRPGVKDYLETFQASKLICTHHYPIRRGRWWLLYLIRYGFVPERWFPQIARHELKRRREETGSIRFYKDFLFILEKRS